MTRHLHLLWLVPMTFAITLILGETIVDQAPIETFRQAWDRSFGVVLGWLFAHCYARTLR